MINKLPPALLGMFADAAIDQNRSKINEIIDAVNELENNTNILLEIMAKLLQPAQNTSEDNDDPSE